MLNFERSSLSQKLSLLSLLSTGTALILVFAAFAVGSVIEHRREARIQLGSLAGVIAGSSADALLHRNRRQAEANLSALKAQPEITGAILFDARGRSFAAYGKADREQLGNVSQEALSAANSDSAASWSPRLRVYHRIDDARGIAGVVMIEASMIGMWIDIAKGLLVLALAMGGAMLVALPLAGRFKASVADPITRLISAARKVTETQNYTLRVPHNRTDELGALIDSFNAMLAQIEERGSALAMHRDELENQVGVRTEQLEKAKNAAEAASRAKSAFLATMSHEIRTPMNGVLGMTEMLLATPLTETQRKYASMVQRSGEHLLVIINDILDFSKIEAGKLTVEYIHFNLCDLLDEIDNVYRPQAQAKNIAFHIEVPSDLPVAVCGDPNRLRQVLANLVGNAIKFTDRGEIRVCISMLTESEQNASLRFEVHDTGIGIAREARSRIFEAFSQADDSTTRRYGGTGLGLAISKQLVELMGGKIGVENALTQGSMFWFTVTFDKRRIEADRLDEDSLNKLEGLRVLIVDELDDRRTALASELAQWRVSSDQASCESEAMDALTRAAESSRAYDVALVAMSLKGTSGLALTAMAKARLSAAHTRYVLLSSLHNAADPVQRREAGVSYQLITPVRAGDLFDCIARSPRHQARAEAAPVIPERPAPAVQTRRRKVLLAEDNPVNVDVATAMLDAMGLDVQCVGNGEEALNAVRSGSYELVLMDCQMPVMDGFAATAEIRRHEHMNGKTRKLPVVAITANALQGDRESCLAAGMDDYLSKPFTQQQLAAVISRWIGLPITATVHHSEMAPAPAPAADKRDAINRHALDNIRALSEDRGPSIVRKVVSAYVDDTPLHLQTLRRAISGGDSEKLRSAAHSLKSSSANVGAETLAQLCKQMETLGRTETTEGAATILSDMEQEFQAVRHSLTEILERET
ncbi:response regulator [Pseudoduganella sp. GCM10020061]|uniref:response regulator n=1 Tax=Pseudoduganella sp. GCM10020061 TaxID=3317345 RepID=UPI003636E445